MFNGKMKAITFSYDDGFTQDKRLIDIFNNYGLKSTFNLNSELLGSKHKLTSEKWSVNHPKNERKDIKEIYKGHEIAVHTLTHPNLTGLDEKEIIRQVEKDRKNLEEIVGYYIVGMAYPCGGTNNDDRVAEIIRNHTSIKYSRTITSNYSCVIQDNLFRFNPTVYHCEMDKMFELAEEFITLKPNKPQLLYIWGY